MSFESVETLWSCITMIEAQEQLKALSVVDWPSMNKSGRTKMHKELYSKAYPSETRQKNYITPSDLQRVLGR